LSVGETTDRQKGFRLSVFYYLEVKVESAWKEVIRYDCAHGYAHRDIYNLLGRQKKEDLPLRFEDALNLADDDIDDNWEIYAYRFLRGDFP
jgi:hypothetical protein